MLQIVSKNPLGIDYGIWTEASGIKDDSIMQVDFVIIGAASGSRTNNSWAVNKTIEHPRIMIYGFYHSKGNWLDQAKKWLELALEIGAKAIWLDWERSDLSPFGDNEKGYDARRAAEIIFWLRNQFDGQVGIYSNFNDYIVYFKPYIEDHASIPFWVAWPDEQPDYNSASFHSWFAKTGRGEGNYQFEQFAWKISADQVLVLENDKKSLDGDKWNGTLAELDEWLGIEYEEPDPEDPQTPCKLGEIIKELKALITKYED
jgi:hypothetical protein